MKRRWEVVCRDVNGRIIGTEQFWLRRSATRMAQWHTATASGSHLFQTPLARPLFTVEVLRVI